MPLFGFDAQTDKLADVEVEGGFLGRVRRSPGVGLLIRYKFCSFEQETGRDVDVGEEVHADSNATFGTARDPSCDDLSFEGPENNKAEFDVDVDEAIAVADETIRNFEKIVHADTKSDLLHHFVGVFLVDLVLNLIPA